MILSIDPGVHECGVAVWGTTAGLQRAYLCQGLSTAMYAGAWSSMAGALGLSERDTSRVVIELPQVYVRSRSKGDPNDLIQLAACVGAIAQAFRHVPVHIFKPSEWKGQVPKLVMIERIKERLSPDESACVKLPKDKKFQTDVWDAVGLGLHYLKRLRG